MPTLTPEQRKKWLPKTTGGGVPHGKRHCRGCAEDKPKKEFCNKTTYCKACAQWYKDHDMKLKEPIDHRKYRKEFIYNAF